MVLPTARVEPDVTLDLQPGGGLCCGRKDASLTPASHSDLDLSMRVGGGAAECRVESSRGVPIPVVVELLSSVAVRRDSRFSILVGGAYKHEGNMYP